MYFDVAVGAAFYGGVRLSANIKTSHITNYAARCF